MTTIGRTGERSHKIGSGWETNVTVPQSFCLLACYVHLSIWYCNIKLELPFTARRYAQVRSLLSSGVCPSVRHIRILYPHGWRYRQTSFSARYRHHSSFLTPSASYPIRRETLSARAENTRGKFCDFRLKSPFISETIATLGCYGTLIGSHRRRIDPWQFRWPWVTLTRVSKSCQISKKILIANHTWHIECYHIW